MSVFIKCLLCVGFLTTLGWGHQKGIDVSSQKIPLEITHALKGLDQSTQDLEHITLLAGGFSKADLYKIQTTQGTYVIKIMKGSPLEDVITEFEAAQLASEGGFGPKLYYTNIRDKTLVMSYIDNDFYVNSAKRHATPFHTRAAVEDVSRHRCTLKSTHSWP